MHIPADEITEKETIGICGSSPILRLRLLGGLHIVAMRKDQSLVTMGAGSHPGIARHIAKQRHPDANFFDLKKSEEIDPKCFGDILPVYKKFTTRLALCPITIQ